jgi:hypothetical protein
MDVAASFSVYMVFCYSIFQLAIHVKPCHARLLLYDTTNAQLLLSQQALQGAMAAMKKLPAIQM